MYSGIVYISGKVGSVDESSKYDDDFNEIKFSYLSLSGDGFMVSANIYFEDTNIYDKLTKDTNLIISGVIEEFTAYGFNVINAKLESGKLGSGVSKISSSINKPLNLIRKFKIRKKLNYFTFKSYNKPYYVNKNN